MKSRNEVTSFSGEPVPEEVIEKVIQSAGTSPSGANQQPWKFALVKDPQVKKAIRNAAEKLEKSSEEKDYMEEAPYLITVFRENYGLEQDKNGQMKKIRHYYALESTAISAGFLLSALQHAGLDSIIHTPFKELSAILNRPKNESPIALFAVGYSKETDTARQAEGKPFSELVFGDIDVTSEKTKTTPSSEAKIINTASNYYETIRRRRNIRDFSTEDIDESLLVKALDASVSTPACAGSQPYRFAVIKNHAMKKIIREQAEAEEKKLYEERISDEWREALAPLGTNWMKPHLTDAPYLIIAFKVDETEAVSGSANGVKGAYDKHQAMTSAGMAVGVLTSALHFAGVCTLTHTPSPMAFLRDLLNRPKNEMPIVVLPVGYPAPDCQVPDITKKPLDDILIKY